MRVKLFRNFTRHHLVTSTNCTPLGLITSTNCGKIKLSLTVNCFVVRWLRQDLCQSQAYTRRSRSIAGEILTRYQ